MFILPASQFLDTGYFAGGGETNGLSIDGFQFATETMKAVQGTITDKSSNSGQSGAQSQTKGYIALNLTTFDVMRFVDESVYQVSHGVNFFGGAGSVNSAAKGYFGGGASGTTPVSTLHTIQFSDETTATPSIALTVARVYPSGVTSATKGYFMGGYTSPGGANETAEIDGVQYSDDTIVNPTAALSAARWNASGSFNSATKGYVLGGMNDTPAYLTTIDAFTFATEASAAMGISLATARSYTIGVNSGVRGYIAGGESSGDFFWQEIEGIEFSNDSAVNPAAALPIGRRGGIGIQSGGFL